MESISKESCLGSPVTKKNRIQVGSTLPYGPWLLHQHKENIVRMKDIGVNRRLLIIGVLGSFTPDCWNRHLFLVLKHYDYFKERGVHHFCCLATNDPFAHEAWGEQLGCNEKILMYSDPLAKYTNLIGMDVVIPWLNNRTRSRRYIILADDMIVTKMLVSEGDNGSAKWDCEHIFEKRTYSDALDCFGEVCPLVRS